MRPPARGSNVTVSPAAAERVWSSGHHSEVLVAHTAKACSGEQATVKVSTIGSIT
jgi:hypothetical protein